MKRLPQSTLSKVSIAGSPNEETIVQLYACVRALKRKLPAVYREAEGRTESEIREIIRERLVPVVDRYFPEKKVARATLRL
jgi:hypothetical protein